MGIFGKKSNTYKKSLELDSKLFKRINTLLSAYPGEDVSTSGIAYFKSDKSEKQPLEVIGESFFQSDLKQSFKLDKWEYGLLIPEQDNPEDANAVAVYLITKDFGVTKVGYLKKETAKKVSQKIANLLAGEGLVIPVLAIIKKGDEPTSNWGVKAFAMTDHLKF